MFGCNGGITMECHEYEKLFEKYFDREITILEYKAIRSHLGRCQLCRETFFDHLFALDLLDSMTVNEPDELLKERVLEKLPNPKEKSNWRRWTIGVAACFILALTLTVVEQNIGQQNDSIKASVVVSDIKNQMKLGKRSVILPNNANIKGDLSVNGDVVVLGKVYGKLRANRVILVQQADSDFFHLIGKKLKKMITTNSSKTP